MQYPFLFVTFVTAPLEVDSDCETVTVTAVEPDQRSREQRAATSAVAGPETAAAD